MIVIVFGISCWRACSQATGVSCNNHVEYLQQIDHLPLCSCVRYVARFLPRDGSSCSEEVHTLIIQ